MPGADVTSRWQYIALKCLALTLPRAEVPRADTTSRWNALRWSGRTEMPRAVVDALSRDGIQESAGLRSLRNLADLEHLPAIAADRPAWRELCQDLSPGKIAIPRPRFFPRFFLKDRVFRDFPAFFELFCCATRTHSALFGQQGLIRWRLCSLYSLWRALTPETCNWLISLHTHWKLPHINCKLAAARWYQ